MNNDKMRLLPLVCLMILVLTAMVSHVGRAQQQGVQPQHPAVPIGAGRIVFTHDHVFPGTSNIHAFVATGSLSPVCLATFGESNFAQAGMSMFCGARTVNGQDGVLITVGWETGLPDDLILIITLYQEGAKGYAAPVLATD
jgi:hypothetical protein